MYRVKKTRRTNYGKTKIKPYCNVFCVSNINGQPGFFDTRKELKTITNKWSDDTNCISNKTSRRKGKEILRYNLTIGNY